MWNEIQELLIGLAGAVAVLAAIYVFYITAYARAEEERPTSAPDEDANARAVAADPDGPERHVPLIAEPADDAGSMRSAVSELTAPSVEKIFITTDAAAPMRRVADIEVVAGRGLKGDRYFLGRGHWSESDQHEVTMIMQEDLDAVSRDTGLLIQAGQHRRNLVTRGIDLQTLIGKRFRIGTAYFGAARPRPPCLYLQRITEVGMARALVGRGGIGVHCFRGGTIGETDTIVILDLSVRGLIAKRWAALLGSR